MTRRKAYTNSAGYRIGEAHPHARLKDSEVGLILDLLADGMPCRSIALKFGVSLQTVRSISCGRRRSQTPMVENTQGGCRGKGGE